MIDDEINNTISKLRIKIDLMGDFILEYQTKIIMLQEMLNMKNTAQNKNNN